MFKAIFNAPGRPGAHGGQGLFNLAPRCRNTTLGTTNLSNLAPRYRNTTTLGGHGGQGVTTTLPPCTTTLCTSRVDHQPQGLTSNLAPRCRTTTTLGADGGQGSTTNLSNLAPRPRNTNHHSGKVMFKVCLQEYGHV